VLKLKHGNYRILGCIKYSIAKWSKSVIVPKHSTVMWPHLEFCVHFGASQYKMFIKTSECIQRRAANMVKGLEDITYEKQLRILGLFSIENRRLREDIAIYKFLMRESGEGGADLFSLMSSARTRGNGVEL